MMPHDPRRVRSQRENPDHRGGDVHGGVDALAPLAGSALSYALTGASIRAKDARLLDLVAVAGEIDLGRAERLATFGSWHVAGHVATLLITARVIPGAALARYWIFRRVVVRHGQMKWVYSRYITMAAFAVLLGLAMLWYPASADIDPEETRRAGIILFPWFNLTVLLGWAIGHALASCVVGIHKVRDGLWG